MNQIFKDIEIVAFDIMGVILPNPSLVRKGLYPIYKDRYSYEYIKELYRDVRSNVDGDISLWNCLGVDDPEAARKEFLDTYEIDSEFEEFRNYLDENDIGKGVISNMPKEWGEYILSKLKLQSDFGPIVLSGAVGMQKPDKEIYLRFLEEAEVEGNRVLFVDDKLENLEIAKRLGMKTVLFDRGKEQEGYKPDLVIKSFAELI